MPPPAEPTAGRHERQVADPWITMAAIATATQELRLGPMVTPLARRRPANLDHPDQLAEIVATVTDLRQRSAAPYDFVVGLAPGIDPAPMHAVGATWWLVEFPWDAVSVDRVRGVLREGPAVSGRRRRLGGRR